MDETGGPEGTGRSRRIGGWVAAGIGVAAAGAVGAAGLFYLRERRTERPDFEVELEDGAFELRKYPALLTAETVKAGARERALNDGFRALADYIFGETRGGGPTIAMTAPVLAEPESGGWRIRFVMPAGWSRDTLPPTSAGVEIATMPERQVAAVRFTGRADDALLADKEAELRAWIAERWLAANGPAEHAFYNSPFIPGPLRHNEVLIPVRQIPRAPEVGTR